MEIVLKNSSLHFYNANIKQFEWRGVFFGDGPTDIAVESAKYDSVVPVALSNIHALKIPAGYQVKLVALENNTTLIPFTKGDLIKANQGVDIVLDNISELILALDANATYVSLVFGYINGTTNLTDTDREKIKYYA